MASTASTVAQQCDDDASPEHELAAWHDAVRHRAWAPEAGAPAPPLRRARIGVLLFVLLLHALLLIALRHAMHQPPLAQIEPLQVRLIDEAASSEPPLPRPPPLPTRAPPRVPSIARAQPRVAPAPAAPPATEPPPLHLFNPDGSIALPRDSAPDSTAMTATFATPPPSDEALRIMRHQRPLKVRPNHFAEKWRPANSGSAFTDFIADHLTFEQEFVLPWGTHVKCAEVFLFLAAGGGCGWETPYRYYVPTEKWRPASALDEE